MSKIKASLRVGSTFKLTPFHPGFDASAGCALYDADGLTFSVYEWEVKAV